MSVYMVVGTDEPHQIASNMGYSEIVHLVESLSDEFPCLDHLTEHGWEQDLNDLELELDELVRRESVAVTALSTLQAMLELLKTRDPDAASVVITDGFSSETDDGE